MDPNVDRVLKEQMPNDYKVIIKLLKVMENDDNKRKKDEIRSILERESDGI